MRQLSCKVSAAIVVLALVATYALVSYGSARARQGYHAPDIAASVQANELAIAASRADQLAIAASRTHGFVLVPMARGSMPSACANGVLLGGTKYKKGEGGWWLCEDDLPTPTNVKGKQVTAEEPNRHADDEFCRLCKPGEDVSDPATGGCAQHCSENGFCGHTVSYMPARGGRDCSGVAGAAPCVVYSFGINDDWSFDKDASDTYGCQVHGFDPSPHGLASKEAFEAATTKRKYHAWGLGATDTVHKPGEVPFRWPGIGYMAHTNTLPWHLKTVSTTMHELGHAKITVLKMDVEGAEWYAVQDMVKSNLISGKKIKQFCVELHFDPLKYRVITSGRPDGGFGVAQIAPDDMNYIELLQTLMREGLTLWKWKLNADDPNCVEASFKVN